MTLHGKKKLGEKDRKVWRCDKILVHLEEFVPILQDLLSVSLRM